jgi:putative inorganic carbon (HCO3(-)) transporter
MFFIPLYLGVLYIAPQLWIEPFVGMRFDLVLYPAWMLWTIATGRGLEFFRLRAQDWFFVGLIVWIALSLIKSGSEYIGIIVFTYTKWFVLYRLVAVTLKDMKALKSALLWLLFFGMVLAVEGIQHMNNPDGVGWAGQSFAWMDDEAANAGVAGRTRWINIFDGPGVFCVVYTMALPVAMQLSMRPFGLVVRAGGLAMTAVLLLATYYTGSRGGFLATVGIVGLLILVRLKISLPRMIAAVTAMMMVLMLAPSYLTSTSDSHGSAQHRIDMWAEGIEMVQQNPVLGIGRGNFAAYTGRLIAHNSGIEMMGELGMPGLYLWMGLIYMACRNTFAARAGTDDLAARSYLTALVLAIAGYMLSSLFVTLEYETFYFLLALGAAAGGRAAAPVTFTKRDAGIVAGIAVGFFILLKSVVMAYH